MSNSSSSAWFVGRGLTPLWCLSTPKFSLTPPTILVKNSQNYIADLLWFYHKSSTEYIVYVISDNLIERYLSAIQKQDMHFNENN